MGPWRRPTGEVDWNDTLSGRHRHRRLLAGALYRSGFLAGVYDLNPDSPEILRQSRQAFMGADGFYFCGPMPDGETGG
ncbi:hypothetical protein D3C81_1920420 [compost metagenome]